MKSIIGSLLILVATHCWGTDFDDALTRFTTLQRLTAGLKPSSTPQEVKLLLGAPTSKGTEGWNHMETKVWDYLHYTDDEHDLLFSVAFDPKTGCAVGAVHTMRSQISKLAKVASNGTVLHVDRPYLGKDGNGLLCDVRLEDGTSWVVAVNSFARMTGEPLAGAGIRIVHYGVTGSYNFVGQNSLYLESIEFVRQIRTP